MNPLPPLPPGLDPFAFLGPLAPLLEPLVRLLRLPLELINAALNLAAAVNVNAPAAMAAANPGLGAFFELLFTIFLIAAVVVVLLAVLFGLGVGTMLAAAVTAYVTHRRAARP